MNADDVRHIEDLSARKKDRINVSAETPVYQNEAYIVIDRRERNARRRKRVPIWIALSSLVFLFLHTDGQFASSTVYSKKRSLIDSQDANKAYKSNV